MILLVLNLGLKSARCIAFSSENGEVLSQASEPIRTYLNNYFVEQDPLEWRRLCWEVIRKVTTSLGRNAEQIGLITVTTSASCLTYLDARGTPLGRSILVSDTRSIAEARMLQNTVEFQAVQSITGMKSSPDLMLPKIMWLLRHEKDVSSQIAHYVNAGDYLIAQLTDLYYTDPNNALKFHYISSKQSYPIELYESLGLDATKFPRVVESGTDIGSVVPKVCRELGIPTSCKVIISTYDALAAVVGTGAFEVGEAVDVSGTVTSFRVITDHHLFDADSRIYVTPYVGKNRWLAGGSNNLGGGVIEWLRQLLFKSEDGYGEMEALIQSQPPCPGGLIFLPHLLGERTPLWNPDCRGVFFGLNRSHGRPQLARSVFEGVCFSIRDIAETLRELGLRIDSVTVSGGLSRLNMMNQLKADVLGLRVRKLDNFETTSIGAAIICLLGQKIIEEKSNAFKRFCKTEEIFEPNRKNHEIYNDFFQLYRTVYQSLRKPYKLRAEVMSKRKLDGIDELSFAENL